MTGRALFLLGLFGAALAACTQGTTGWVIGERGGSAGVVEAAGSGTAGEDLGEAGTAEAAGAAGTSTENAPHCPTRFESACSPLVVLDNKDIDGSGRLFSDAIPDPSTTLGCIARDVCSILFRKTTEIRPLAQINLVIEDFDGVSETFASGPDTSTIHMSSRYLQQVADAHANVKDEITGILYYQTTNMYQSDDGDGGANSWLVEGVADYVRYAGGYLSDDFRGPGGKYNDGNTTTGFFLVYLESQYPDFVYELNQSLNPNDPVVWSPTAFQDITGKKVDVLWAAYQATF